MDTINREYVVDYIRGLYTQKDPFLNELEEFAKVNHIPIIEPESAKLLEVLIRMNKPKRILELGTAIGYSAILMARIDPEIGVVTLEISEEMTAKARENIEYAGLSERIEILVGDCGETVKNMDGYFDFILIDAAKGHYQEYFDNCLRLVKSGSIIFSDNVLFKGTVANPGLAKRRKRTIVHRMRSFLDYITNLDTVYSSVIPIGDGVAVSVVE